MTRTAGAIALLQKRSRLDPTKVKLSLFFIKHNTMTGCVGGGGGEKKVCFHVFVNFHKIEVSGPENTDRIAPYTHCTGNWLVRSGGLDKM